MQLVAMGAQDVYLTGNPQITFFKVVYRRHTNFSKECIAQQFTGSAALGSSVSCTLARNGDLVQEIYLKATLACAVAADLDDFVLNDVTPLIKTVEVEIGGQKIDKHYSQWLDIYNELFETSHDYRTVMNTGNGTDVADKDTPASVTCYIPLRFWFNRNPGLALPLIALQYHEVKVNVTLGAATDLFGHVHASAAVATSGEACAATTGAGTKVGVALSSADLLVNYLYLDTDERRRFAQVSHEYLIEQVQHTGTETAGTAIDMTFNHPVKALFWTGTDWTKTKLQLNGHDRAAEQPHDYYHLLQPYECGLGHSGKSLNATTRAWDYVASGGAVGMYSFCLKPAEHQPSGTCNFSRIDNARLNMGAGAAAPVWLFAMNYNVLRIMSGMGGLAYSN